MRLGTLLLRNASIGLSQLESALRNQVLYGGRLGTNLVELGFVEVDLLSQYLADLSGVPSATPEMLDLAPADLLARLGADLAHQLCAIPLGQPAAHHDGGSIPVAMVEPHDRDAISTLRSRLGGPIAPYVMPELRAFYYLERHFGQPRQARFVRTGGRTSMAAPLTTNGASSSSPSSGGHGNGRLSSPAISTDAGSGNGNGSGNGADRRRIQPPSGIVMPPSLLVPPRRKRPSSLPTPIAGEPVVSFAAACERIAAATHRDELADTFISYAKGRVSALLVFLVRDANAMCWRGYLASGTTVHFEEISVPLGAASAFQAAHDTLTSYNGPPPSPAHPVESKLWEALGELPDPVHATVVPVILKQRAVNLVYAHAPGGVSVDLVDELGILAQHAQDAYLRLIRQSKG
jgi:Type II secretion system (T2SS), protein E, N-terminal domain